MHLDKWEPLLGKSNFSMIKSILAALVLWYQQDISWVHALIHIHLQTSSSTQIANKSTSLIARCAQMLVTLHTNSNHILIVYTGVTSTESTRTIRTWIAKSLKGASLRYICNVTIW